MARRGDGIWVSGQSPIALVAASDRVRPGDGVDLTGEALHDLAMPLFATVVAAAFVVIAPPAPPALPSSCRV
jgi:hypothetical protein